MGEELAVMLATQTPKKLAEDASCLLLRIPEPGAALVEEGVDDVLTLPDGVSSRLRFLVTKQSALAEFRIANRDS